MGQARKEIAGCWKRLYATLNVEESAKRRFFSGSACIVPVEES
jgi:hypothetical protein